MRKNILLTGWFIFCAAAMSTVCSAQQATQPPPTSTSWKFRSDDYLGLAAGQWGNYGLLQTVNGVYKGPWFMGLGAGMDNYRFRSVPLFVSVTRDLLAFNKKNGLFLNLDGGTNLPWCKGDFLLYGQDIPGKFHAGSWFSGGLGYKWKLSPRTGHALLVSVNYSEKRLGQEQKTQSLCPAPGCPFGDQTFIYEYLIRVFLFKIGFMF